jgi:hypothetical protein
MKGKDIQASEQSKNGATERVLLFAVEHAHAWSRVTCVTRPKFEKLRSEIVCVSANVTERISCKGELLL